MKATLRAFIQKSTLMVTAFILAVSTLTAAMPFVLSQDTAAISFGDTIVRAGATQGWSTSGSTAGGTASFVQDANAPLGFGALELKTTASSSAKARYVKSASNIKLDDVKSGLSYSTKQVSASFSAGLPAYQLEMCLSGTYFFGACLSGYTTLTYEPYASEGNSAVQNNVWQTWNVSGGKFYSSKSVGSIQGSAGSPVYTLSQILGEFPNARVTTVGLNVGGSNPSYTVLADNLNFGGKTYDFEPVAPTPELVGIDAYYVKNTYKGIGVDIKTKYLTDATSVEVKVDRTTGGPVTKTAKLPVLNALNTGSSASVTAPIVIQQGSYNEAGSSSWNQPTATWNSITTPTNVTVTIAYGNGSTLVKSLPLGATAGPFATLAEVMPLDVTDPNFAIESPVNGSFVSGTQTIEARISDTENDITKVLMGIPGEASSRSWTPVSLNSKITKNGDIFSTDFDTTTVADGPAYVVLRGTDAAGNTRYWNNNAGNRQHVFTVDNTDPTLKVNLNRTSYVTSGATVGPNQVPEIEAADLNFDRVDVIKNGTVVNSWTRNGVYTERRAKIGFLAQGTYTIRAYDAAGNTSEDFVITIDKTGPVTEVTNATVLGDTVTVEGTVSDTTNLRYYYCWLTTNQTITVDGHTFTPGQEVKLNNNADSTRNAACNTTWANGNNDFSGVLGGFNIPNVPDGSYTVNLVAYDLAGNNNAASPATYTFTLDRTAPAVAITSVTAGLISGTADLDATIILTIDGVDTLPFTPAADGTWAYVVDPAFGEGAHTVVATAYDAVGNERIATSSFTVLAPASEDEDEPEVAVNPQGITFPPAFNPGAPDVQGDSTDNGAAVEGDSTEKTPAQAVNSDANQGKLLGLAWYWWLLILAAAAVLAWWIIAAVRRRNADA